MSWLLNGPFDNTAGEAKPSDYLPPESGGSGASLNEPKQPLTARAFGDWWRLITGAKQAEEFSAAEAQKARDENRYLSNTAAQRGVKDYQAAGLNPAAVATTGGASTPSSPSAHGVASGSNSFVSGMFRLLATAVGGAMASRAYASVSSAGSMPRAIQEGKEVMNLFDKGFASSKWKSFGNFGSADKAWSVSGKRLGKLHHVRDAFEELPFDYLVNSLYT